MEAVFQPEFSSTIGGYSFLIGVASLIITILGFAVTLWQLSQAKTKARVVAEAVINLKRTLEHYDSTTQIERAISALENATRLSRTNNWNSTRDQCDRARESLHKAMLGDINPDGKIRLEAAHSSIVQMIVHLSRAESGKRGYPEPTKISLQFTDLSETLRSVQRGLVVELGK